MNMIPPHNVHDRPPAPEPKERPQLREKGLHGLMT